MKKLSKCHCQRQIVGGEHAWGYNIVDPSIRGWGIEKGRERERERESQ